MTINQIVNTYELRPKRLFLVDGFGALVSAFFLGVVLVRFERFFGIPRSTLYFLASLPIFFALYDLYCYRTESHKMGRLLKIIAVTNLLYCFLSIGLSFYHFQSITPMGWTYILVEIFIVMFIATIEFKVAHRLIANHN